MENRESGRQAVSSGAVSGSLLLFYGGTFDPVHNGHLAVARAAHALLGCPVRLMPAADPPHRAPPGASAVERAAMLDLAVADAPGLCVDRRELMREGRSYTVDTLHALRAEVGQVPVALLLGADSFLSLASWKQWRELFELSHLVVAGRPGLEQALPSPPEPLASALQRRWTDDPADLVAAPAGRVIGLNQPLHDVSATELRTRIASGQPWQRLLPEAVAGYIAQHRLYRHADTAHTRL